VFHLAADGRVLAVEAVNAPAEFMGGRAMILRRKCVAAGDLGNLSLSMQQLAA
jgi:3-phenylpropionate/trans-cinnamate dioxygenase ferredoxin reductase subunit